MNKYQRSSFEHTAHCITFLFIQPATVLFLAVIQSALIDAGASSSTPKNLFNLDTTLSDNLNLTAAAVTTGSNQFQNEYQFRQPLVKAVPISSDRHKTSSSSYPDKLANNELMMMNHVPFIIDYSMMTPSCKGRVRLAAKYGPITDGYGNYLLNVQCSWLIDSGMDNATIGIQIVRFNTECNYDTLSIYAGDSVYSKLVATFSGDLKDFRSDLNVEQSDYSISDSEHHQISGISTNSSDAHVNLLNNSVFSLAEPPPYELRISSGKVLVVFNSDSAQSMPGFSIGYSVNACPLGCSGRGECDFSTLKCKCANSHGDGCQYISIPKKLLCDNSNSTSECALNQSNQKSWTRLVADKSDSIAPRAFHQCVIVDGNLWFFGGRTDKSANPNMGVYRNFKTSTIVALDLRKREWVSETLDISGVTGKDHLAELSGHSIAAHGHKVFIYGGISMNGSILDALSVFDTKTLTLGEIPNGKGAKGKDEEFVPPLSVTGHSANIVDGYMYIFLGYNPKFGYLNFAQKFNIANNSWTMIERRGSSIEGTIGHTSTYDSVARLIYIFGGHALYQSNKLYSFDPQTELWTYLKSSPSPRYHHNAIILNSHLLILGQSFYGSVHKSDQCFQESHLIYDLSCSQPIRDENKTTIPEVGCERTCWNEIDAVPRSSMSILKRHGYSLINNDNKELILFGGITGFFTNDLYTLNIPSCSNFTTKDECEKPRLAAKCDWNNLNSNCEPRDRTFSPQTGSSDIVECSKNETADYRLVCEARYTCPDCLSTNLGCVWCGSAHCQYKKCKGFTLEHESCKRPNLSVETVISGNSSELTKSASHLSATIDSGEEVDCKSDNCYLCQSRPQCSWQNDACTYSPANMMSALGSNAFTPREELDSFNLNLTTTNSVSARQMLQHIDPFNKLFPRPYICEKPCMTRRSCTECTSTRCIWLTSSDQCIESSAYFAYGGHFTGPYVAHSSKCLSASCQDIESCDACLANRKCGWLNDQSQTGLGRCLEGASSGPISTSSFEFNLFTANQGETEIANWYYSSCPACQCNGHSTCNTNSSTCTSCLDHTEGNQCSKCAANYYGTPTNGGTCKPCQCSGRAQTCNRETGRCNCNVKGVIGHNCDLCDKTNSYVSIPQSSGNITCYYNLTTDYQYTFNMTKPDDHFYSEINFINVPNRRDSDVDFSIACSRLALVDISSDDLEFGNGFKRRLHTKIECGSFRLRFTHDQIKMNHSFFVHVHNFQTPFILQIAFSQGHRIFLPQFFFTFSSCFLFLFALSGVFWKIKHEYDLYNQRQRRFIEMEQMASRPLSTILLESMKKAGSSQQGVEPTPIAYEPLLDNNVGVLSVFVQLPGKPNLAIASALISLNDDNSGPQDGLNK